MINDLNQLTNLYLSQGLSEKTATEILHEQFGITYNKKEIYSIVNNIKKTL